MVKRDAKTRGNIADAGSQCRFLDLQRRLQWYNRADAVCCSKGKCKIQHRVNNGVRSYTSHGGCTRRARLLQGVGFLSTILILRRCLHARCCHVSISSFYTPTRSFTLSFRVGVGHMCFTGLNPTRDSCERLGFSRCVSPNTCRGRHLLLLRLKTSAKEALIMSYDCVFESREK